MSSHLKNTILTIIIFLLSLSPVLAQGTEAVGPASFIGSYTLWVAIMIGFLASGATLYFAMQMQGGVVGKSLTFIGAGMFFVVAGFLVVVVKWADPATQGLVHDIAFILGYILILVGALRLREITG